MRLRIYNSSRPPQTLGPRRAVYRTSLYNEQHARTTRGSGGWSMSDSRRWWRHILRRWPAWPPRWWGWPTPKTPPRRRCSAHGSTGHRCVTLARRIPGCCVPPSTSVATGRQAALARHSAATSRSIGRRMTRPRPLLMSDHMTPRRWICDWPSHGCQPIYAGSLRCVSMRAWTRHRLARCLRRQRRPYGHGYAALWNYCVAIWTHARSIILRRLAGRVFPMANQLPDAETTRDLEALPADLQ